jgi:hypothetical protein
MKRAHLPTKSLFTGILGIAVGGMGCSDDGATVNDQSVDSGGVSVGGNGDSGPTTTGGTSTGDGQVSTSGMTGGGATPATTNGATTMGGATGGGGATVAGSGGAGTTDSSTTDVGTTDAGTTDAGMGGSGMTSGGMTNAGMGGAATTGVFTGTCTESEGAGRSVSGSGPHDVVIETNSEDGIRCGTIFRPADLGGAEKYPIFVWGEGGCSQNGLSNQAAMGEIASWGYFIVADGTPGGENACQGRQNGAAFLDYITWAIAENDKPCSAYYQSLDTTKIAADGFSCGGLMAENVAGDRRFTAIGITSSGLTGPNNNLWDSMHAPFKIMNGGSSDIAYQNGLNDYAAISSRGIPILYFAKSSAGHGGDLGQARGDFNLVNLAWLNWQLKGDEGATGKAFLIGPSCAFCNDSGWEFMSANID